MKLIRKRWPIFGSVIAVLLLVTGMVMFQSSPQKSIAEGTDTNKIEIPNKDKTKPLGTDENPFLILEIVPYEGYAEMGYYVKGQEPIDIAKLEWSGTYAPEFIGDGKCPALDLKSQEYIQTINPSESMLAALGNGNVKEVSGYKVDQAGYYYKVEDGKGHYRAENPVIEEGIITSADFVEDNTGDYDWYGELNETVAVDPTATDRVYATRTGCQVYEGTRYEFENRELFKKECLELTDPDEINDYKIKVITVTPKQLNATVTSSYDPTKVIDEADIIFITDKSANLAYVKAFNDLHRDDLFPGVEIQALSNYDNLNFYTENNDICWEAIEKIFKKQANMGLATGVNACPVVYDTNSLTSSPSNISSWQSSGNLMYAWETKTPGNIFKISTKGNVNNVYKLGLLLRDMNSIDLYEMYFETNKIQSVPGPKGVTTGSFSGLDNANSDADAKIYWDKVTLYPYQLLDNKDSNMSQLMTSLGYPYENFSDNVYAMDGMYIYNADIPLIHNFILGYVYETDQTKDAFDFYHEKPSHVFKKDGSGKEMLTPAEVIRYLLNVMNDGKELQTVKILEVQPGKIYTEGQRASLFHTDGYWNNYLKSRMPSFKGTVILTRMTTREFNCRVEDLNENYDFVYFGSAVSDVNATVDTSKPLYFTVGNEITVYDNTKKMNKWLGSAAHNSNTFKSYLSGNDISRAKMNALIEYAGSGHPVIFDENLVNSSKAITSVIDGSTYMAKLINQIKTKPSVHRDNNFSGHTLATQLTNNLCILDASTVPLEYNEKKADNQKYVNGANLNNKTLTFGFKITQSSTVSCRYKAIICIDSNADGKFDTATEKLGFSIRDKNDLTKVMNSSDFLTSGKEYTITVDASKYVGAITWQLKIVRYDNGAATPSGIRTSISGISAIKSSSSLDVVKLKILQITSDPVLNTGTGKDGKVTCVLPTKDEITAATSGLTEAQKNSLPDLINAFQGKVKIGTMNASDEVTKSAAMFYYYTKDLNNYKLEFERMTNSQFATLAADAATAAEPSDPLLGFDMIIIGFADSCDDITNSHARAAITSFINEGKATLFTHDVTIHWYNNESTKAFREILGMDRYNIMAEHLWTTSDSKDEFKKTGSGGNLRTNIYGFTDQVLKRYDNSKSKPDGSKDKMSYTETSKVSRINKGQITNYPYLIGYESAGNVNDIINVGTTHAQYYQLDFNDDKIVVWYNLYQTQNGADSKEMYELNDGQNGYYIYNKGNITYSGAGHNRNMCNNVEEIKLFVNTIIAAHRAVPSAAEVEVVNDDATKSGNNYYVYADYDVNLCTDAFGSEIDTNSVETVSGGAVVTANVQTKKVFFVLNDHSPATDSTRRRYITYAYVCPDGTEKILDLKTMQGTTSPQDKTGQPLNIGETYWVEVPINDLKEGNQVNFMFHTKVEFTVDGIAKNLTGQTPVSVIRRGLFNLD